MRLAWLLSMALLLAACQPGLIQEESDDTGQLGAVDAKSSPADTYVQLAAEYLRLGDHATALKKAKKAVMKDPRNANAHLILGLVYEALGEVDHARQAFREARRVDDKNPYVLNAYGRLLCQLGEYEKSFEAFEKAVSNPLYEAPWIALTNAGLCAKAAGEVERAQDYFLRALRANPEFPAALGQMARISYDQGRYLSARAYIQRYREVAEPTAQLLYLSVLTERRLGDADQAQSDLLLLKARFPDSEEVRRLAP